MQRVAFMRSRILRGFFVFVAVAGCLLHRSDGVAAVSSGVVISQVYGGGGNAGSTWKNDFIELFNRGNTPVSLAGMSVQYASAAGTTWQVTPLTAVTLAPGQYYLVQESAGTGGTTSLPTPDASGTIAMSATAGKVALSAATTSLTGACPAGVVDVLGYNSPGTSGCFEGAIGPGLSNTTAAFRGGNGCADTDNNASDFSTGAPNPRNTAAIFAPCSASSTNPSGTMTSNALSYAPGDPITLTVNVTPGTNPTSTGLAVTGNLVSIGLGTPVFTNQGGNTFAFAGVVPSGISGGATSLSAIITDDQSRSAPTSSVSITVVSATSPTATGGASPASVPAGSTTTLTVTATPGTNPVSTGVTVTGDLSAIGGNAVQSFPADGTGTFTFAATVDAAIAPGPKQLPITLSDDQGRTFSFNLPVTVTAPLANSTIVISQLYGGGGNSGASYQNDFVQLYNRGSTTVDLAGWSLQYAAATGTSWDNKQPLGGTIAPNQYYLVALASGGANGAALPDANISGQINMSQTTGKVALVDNGDTLTGPCPISSLHVRDFVGYGGSATCHEGATAAPQPGPATALFRQGAGFIDTNDNGADFATGPPSPFTTAPIVEIGPSVLTTDPLPGAVTAPRDATIEVSFTEPVDVSGAWFHLVCSTTGVHDSATTATGPGARDQYITPNANFAAGETCTATVFKDQVSDQDTDDLQPGTDHLPADYSWSFSIATGAAPPYPAGVHLTLGNPTSATADVNQPDNYLMTKPEYALSYNRSLGRPNWVSWHLTPEWFGTLVRVDTFRADPEVPPDWYRVQSFSFQSSGFDRGHMTPNADRDLETSIPINQATYLMSNMVAQAPDNNQGPWANLENYLRSLLGTDRQNPPYEIYVVSGPAGAGGTGSNGFATTVDNGHVTVPAYTWKVALVLPFDRGADDASRVTCAARTIAVIMPNAQGIRTNSPDDWMNYLTTVDAVEALTGYDLFSNVPPKIQNCIQAGINGNNPQAQEIAFAPIAAHRFGDADFVVTATADSGLPVTLTVTSGPATIDANGTVHLLGAGPVTIRATQPGGTNAGQAYARAVPVDQTFTADKGTQAITFGALGDRTYGDAPFTVSAGGGASGNPVVFAASGMCVSGGQNGATITIVAAGACSIAASQEGSDNYGPAPVVTQIFTVSKATAGFTSLSSPSIEAGTASTTLGGVILAGGVVPGGSVAISLNGSTVAAAIAADGRFSATLPTGSLTPSGGPYTVAFSYAGDGNVAAAAATSSLAVVDTLAPVISNLKATPDTLFFSTNTLWPVLVGYTATDNVGAPVCSLSVTSNADDLIDHGPRKGEKDPDVDVVVVGPHLVLLKAEREPKKDLALIYTITVSCGDGSGNVSTARTDVRVRRP
jgi:endonuclease G